MMQSELWRSLRQSALAVAVFTTLSFTVQSANALVVDFESLPPGGGCYIPSNPFSTQGFDFSTVGFGFFVCGGTRSDLPSNGTNTVGSEEPTVTTMSRSGGGIFSLNSIDLGELFVGTPFGHQVQIDGNLQGGGMVSALFTLDGINDGVGGAADFETFLLPNTFTNLNSVVLTGLHSSQLDPRFMFDNIVVDAQVVPEPALLPLLVIGLAGMAVKRRRKA